MLHKKNIALPAIALAAVTVIFIACNTPRADPAPPAQIPPNTIIIQKDTVYVQQPYCRHKNMYVHDTVFIPHRAPDKSRFGKYEREDQPFIIPRDSTGEELLVNERTWNVDLKDKKYRTRIQGYIHSKRPDGRYSDLPVLIDEENHYDTLSRKLTGTYTPTIISPPVSYALPDTLHNTVDTSFANFYWNNFRYAILPHAVEKKGLNFKVHERILTPTLLHDTIFVIMTLKGVMKAGGQFIDSVSISETRPMKPVMY